MWNLAAKAKILASQHSANLHRIKLPLRSIFFQNNSFFTDNKMATGTHTHTNPFNGTFSGTTQVSRYQKGKTNLYFTEARDSEWQWHQLGHMQVCTLLPCSRQTPDG